MLELADGGMLEFPGTTGANICLKQLPPFSVQKAIENGRYTNLNLVKSNYIIPTYQFDFGPMYPKKNRFIYVPRYISDISMRNAENHKIKWTYYRKKI